jgi:N-methylhydantoinase A
VTVERGRDPRDYTLVAFGGSGPVHAVDLARALEIRRVLVPLAPGVFTAVGMLASDLQHHLVRAHPCVLTGLSLDAANRVLEALAGEGRAMLAAEGHGTGEVVLEFQADLRLVGQGAELTIPLADARFTPSGVEALREAFGREYATTYGYAPDEEIELVNLRSIATVRRAGRLELDALRSAARAGGPAGRRPVSFARGEPARDTVVLPRESLTGEPVAGPAIVESYDSTVVIPPGAEVAADARGNLVITVGRRP